MKRWVWSRGDMGSVVATGMGHGRTSGEAASVPLWVFLLKNPKKDCVQKCKTIGWILALPKMTPVFHELLLGGLRLQSCSFVMFYDRVCFMFVCVPPRTAPWNQLKQPRSCPGRGSRGPPSPLSVCLSVCPAALTGAGACPGPEEHRPPSVLPVPPEPTFAWLKNCHCFFPKGQDYPL